MDDAYQDGMDLEEALAFNVLRDMRDEVRTNPFYWDPYHLGDDPRKRGLLEKALDLFGKAYLIGKPPKESYINMQAMKLLLIDMLKEGQLQAMGYLLPRGLSDRPVTIPPDVWFGRVDWILNEVDGAGLHFVSIRVLDDSSEEEVELLALPAPQPKEPSAPRAQPYIQAKPECEEAKPSEAPPESAQVVVLKKIGRPTTRPIIEQAYGAIEKDYSKSFAYHIQLIQKWIANKRGSDDMEGFGEDVIRKTVGKIFRNARKAAIFSDKPLNSKKRKAD